MEQGAISGERMRMMISLTVWRADEITTQRVQVFALNHEAATAAALIQIGKMPPL